MIFRRNDGHIQSLRDDHFVDELGLIIERRDTLHGIVLLNDMLADVASEEDEAIARDPIVFGRLAEVGEEAAESIVCHHMPLVVCERNIRNDVIKATCKCLRTREGLVISVGEEIRRTICSEIDR